MTQEERSAVIEQLAGKTWEWWREFLLDCEGICVEYERIDETLVSEALGEWKFRNGVWNAEEKKRHMAILAATRPA